MCTENFLHDCDNQVSLGAPATHLAEVKMSRRVPSDRFPQHALYLSSATPSYNKLILSGSYRTVRTLRPLSSPFDFTIFIATSFDYFKLLDPYKNRASCATDGWLRQLLHREISLPIMCPFRLLQLFPPYSPQMASSASMRSCSCCHLATRCHS